MSKSFCLPEQASIVTILAPAADAAGRTGAYVSLRNAHKAYLIFHIKQGNAATVLLTALQASAVAGTGSKVLTNDTPIWACLDAATTDALVRATDAKNYTTDAALKDKVVAFEIDPSKLDLANGFDCIGASTGASNAANITSCLAILTPLRYSENPPLSAVSNT